MEKQGQGPAVLARPFFFLLLICKGSLYIKEVCPLTFTSQTFFFSVPVS